MHMWEEWLGLLWDKENSIEGVGCLLQDLRS